MSDAHSRTLIELGTIVRPHGYEGAILVQTGSGKESAFSYLKSVLIGANPDHIVEFPLTRAQWLPKGWKLTLENLNDEEAAKELRGERVFAKRSQFEPLESSDEYYVADLVGLQVYDTQTKTTVGTLIGVENMGEALESEGGRWWIQTEDKKRIAVPAQKDFIEKVCLEKKHVWVNHWDELSQ